MEHYQDFDRRIGILENEIRSIREEVQLNRRRYHDLNTKIAPMVLEGTDLDRHDREIRAIRASLDKMSGIWTAIVITAIVLSTLTAGLWAAATHFHFLG